MNAALAAFASGLLFAIGLTVGGMTQPAKVTAFLDLFGAWDPSLAFVMMGAILVHAVAYRVIRAQRAPLFVASFSVPTRRDIDGRLLGGAVLFGIGWGLSGFCPGPALTSLVSGQAPALVFVAGMLAGMYGYHLLEGVGRPSVHPPNAQTTTPLSQTPALQGRADA